MNEPAFELPTAYNEQIALLRHTEGWRMLFGYLALIFLVTPFVLGFIVLMMLLPLALAFARVAALYTPAYHRLGRILGVPALPSQLARAPLWFSVYSVIYILFWLAVAAICVRLLFFAGFCDQNLVCLGATRLLFKHPLLQ